MALYIVPSAAVALSASATKTLVLLNPEANEHKVKEFGVSFDAAAAGQSIRVELVRVTTLGAPAGTTVTPLKKDTSSQAGTTTSLTNLTTEPTTYEVLKPYYVRPDGGALVIQNPLGNEEKGGDATDERYGIRVTTPAGVTPNAVAYIEFEE
jgi:hypothetical protein